MKALLSRCALRRSIGVVIEDRRIAVSVVATTPLGRQRGLPRRPGLRRRAPAGCPRTVAPALDQADPSQEDRAGPWVQLGVPESQVFQAVVPITSREPQRLPAVVLPRGRAGDQHPGRGTDHRPAQARAQQAIHGLRGRLAPRRDHLDDRDDGRAGNPASDWPSRSRPRSAAPARSTARRHAARS